MVDNTEPLPSEAAVAEVLRRTGHSITTEYILRQANVFGGDILAARLIENQSAEIEALRAENARLRGAALEVISAGFDHYTARNGRRCSIEGGDGEKCWIVPFDQFEALRAALEGGAK